jgi:hypothetical protein
MKTLYCTELLSTSYEMIVRQVNPILFFKNREISLVGTPRRGITEGKFYQYVVQKSPSNGRVGVGVGSRQGRKDSVEHQKSYKSDIASLCILVGNQS